MGTMQQRRLVKGIGTCRIPKGDTVVGWYGYFSPNCTD